jgi:hypothetical protein
MHHRQGHAQLNGAQVWGGDHDDPPEGSVREIGIDVNGDIGRQWPSGVILALILALIGPTTACLAL